jgi:hypothetical protein
LCNGPGGLEDIVKKGKKGTERHLNTDTVIQPNSAIVVNDQQNVGLGRTVDVSVLANRKREHSFIDEFGMDHLLMKHRFGVHNFCANDSSRERLLLQLKWE